MYFLFHFCSKRVTAILFWSCTSRKGWYYPTVNFNPLRANEFVTFNVIGQTSFGQLRKEQRALAVTLRTYCEREVFLFPGTTFSKHFESSPNPRINVSISDSLSPRPSPEFESARGPCTLSLVNDPASLSARRLFFAVPGMPPSSGTTSFSLCLQVLARGPAGRVAVRGSLRHRCY